MSSRTVSFRVEEADWATVQGAGLDPGEVMRDALRARAKGLRAAAWAREAKAGLLRPRDGSPPSERIIRDARDRE